MESALQTLALLIEQTAASGEAAQAAQLANRSWQRHADRLMGLMEPTAENSSHKAQAACLRFLRAAASASEDVARAVVQRACSNDSTIIALLNACERPQRSKDVCAALTELILVLLPSHPRELLTAEHGRLAAAPLRLIEWVPRSTRIRALTALRRHILENETLIMRTRGPVMNSNSLVKLASLLGGGGDLARVSHGFLLRLSALHAAAEQRRGPDGGAAGGSSASGGNTNFQEARAGHVALTQLLLALQPTASAAQRKIVLAMLSAVPALRQPYLAGRGDAVVLDPKPTRRWVVEVAFLTRVIGDATPTGGVVDARQGQRASRGQLTAALIPPGLGRQFWSRSLLHSSVLVRCTGLNALVAVLRMLCGAVEGERMGGAAEGQMVRGVAKGQRLYETAEGQRVYGAADSPGPSVEAQQELRWVLPDLQMLISLRTALAGATTRLGSLMRVRLLQALQLCRQLMPAVFAETRPHIERKMGRSLVDAVPLVQQLALQLMLPLSAGAATGATDATLALPAAAELCCLARMTLHWQHWRTRKLARQLLVRMLEGSGTMRGCAHAAATEADIWLSALTPATAPYFASLVHHVASSLHEALDAAIAEGQQSGAGAHGNVVGAGAPPLAFSPMAVAAARELAALAASKHRRSRLAAEYLRDVLLSIPRPAVPLKTLGRAAAALFTGDLPQPVPDAGPLLDICRVAAACRRRNALPAGKLAWAGCLSQLLSRALQGDASAAWLALHLPVDAWLRGEPQPAWLVQSPLQAIVHASVFSVSTTELAALLQAQLIALLPAGKPTHTAGAAAEAAAVLCTMQQLRLHVPGELLQQGRAARLLDHSLDSCAGSGTRIGGPSVILAPLLAWQLLQGMRPDGSIHPHLRRFLNAARSELGDRRGQPTLALDADHVLRVERTRAFSAQVAAQLTPRARLYVEALSPDACAGTEADGAALLALLRRLWESGADEVGMEVSMQIWLFEHSALARTAVHRAMGGRSTPAESPLRLLRVEPLLSHLLGARIAAAVAAEQATCEAAPVVAFPSWVPWLIHHVRGIAVAGAMLPLSKQAVPYCVSRMLQLLIDRPHDASADGLAQAIPFLLSRLSTGPLHLEAQISGLLQAVARSGSAALTQVLCSALAAQLACAPAALSTAQVDAHIVAILRVLRESSGSRNYAHAAALYESVEQLLDVPPCAAALAKPSLDLVEAVRAFIAGAVPAPALRLAHTLLTSPVGPRLVPLVAALQNLILRRAPLRGAMASPEGPLVLVVLADLVKLRPAGLAAPLAVELLVGCSLSPSDSVRKQAWAIMSRYCQSGAPLPQLDMQQAADVAFCGEESSVLVQRLAGLEWLRAGQARQMLNSFPVDMLVVNEPVPAAPPLPNAGSGEAARMDEDALQVQPSAGPAPEVLGCLMVLHSLLRSRQCDAPRWLARGAVGLLVMFLSALSPDVRALAYEGLAAFMAVLRDGPSFRERPQVVRLLRSLQDAITQANQRVPTVWAAFVAQGLVITAQPHHAQYKALNSFVLTRAFFDFEDVPMFFTCFHSGSSAQRGDRLWILALLRQGMRTGVDAELCAGRHVLELILGFHDSHLADPQAKRACMGVLIRAGGVSQGANSLIRRHGILQWIRTQCCHGNQPLASTLGLLSLLVALVRTPAFRNVPSRFHEEAALVLLDVLRELQHHAGAQAKPDAHRIAEGTVAVLSALADLKPSLSLSTSVASRLLGSVATCQAAGISLMPEAIQAAASVTARNETVLDWDFFDACIHSLWDGPISILNPQAVLEDAARRGRALVAVLALLEAQIRGGASLCQLPAEAAVLALNRLYHFQSEKLREVDLRSRMCSEWSILCAKRNHYLNRVLLLLSASSMHGAQRKVTALLIAAAGDEGVLNSSTVCAEELLSLVIRGHLHGTGLRAFRELIADEEAAAALSTQLAVNELRAALAVDGDVPVPPP
jgi:hypothetical protein